MRLPSSSVEHLRIKKMVVVIIAYCTSIAGHKKYKLMYVESWTHPLWFPRKMTQCLFLNSQQRNRLYELWWLKKKKQLVYKVIQTIDGRPRAWMAEMELIWHRYHRPWKLISWPVNPDCLKVYPTFRLFFCCKLVAVSFHPGLNCRHCRIFHGGGAFLVACIISLLRTLGKM